MVTNRLVPPEIGLGHSPRLCDVGKEVGDSSTIFLVEVYQPATLSPKTLRKAIAAMSTPKHLTGDKEGIKAFLDKFDVRIISIIICPSESFSNPPPPFFYSRS